MFTKDKGSMITELIKLIFFVYGLAIDCTMSSAKIKGVREINGFVFLCILFNLLNKKEYT